MFLPNEKEHNLEEKSMFPVLAESIADPQTSGNLLA